MACRSCDLKRIYRLFEEKKRREAEEAKALAEAAELEAKEAEERSLRETEEVEKRAHKKKTYIPTEEVAEPVVEEIRPEDEFSLI